MQRKILDFIFSKSLTHGRTILIVMSIITVIMGAFVPRLKISSSYSDLIPKDEPEQAKYIKFMKEFGSSDNLIVVLEGDSDDLKQYADSFAGELLKEKDYIKGVFYKIDASVILKHAALYVPVKDLNKGLEMIKKQNGFITRIQNTSSLYGILQEMNKNLKSVNHDVTPETATKFIDALDALFSEWKEWINDPKTNKLKIAEKVAKSGNKGLNMLNSEGYLFSRDFKMLFLLVQPNNYSDDMSYLKPFMANLRSACDRVYQANPAIKGKIKYAFTGMPAHVFTETGIIYSDVGGAGIVSVIIVSLILLIGFKSFKKMIIGVIPTVAGIVISLGIITLLIGRLNLISSSMLAVLFGIGIDFGIYLIQRTEEELGNGLEMNDAIYKSVVLTSRSVITGGLTTSLAFLAITLSRFVGYSELGLAAGIGLLVVMATTFIMMPALLLLIPVEARDYKLKETIRHAANPKRKRLLQGVVGVSIVITILSIVAAAHMKMDYNYLKLLPRKTESTIYQTKMEDESDFKMSFAFVYDKNLDNLKKIAEEVKKLPTVSRVDSLADLIPSDQEEKLKIIKKFKPYLGNLKISLKSVERTPEEYIKALDEVIPYFEDAQEKAFSGGQAKLVASLEALLKDLSDIKKSFSGSKRLQALSRTMFFEKEIFEKLEKGSRYVREALDPTIITEATFPKDTISRFKSSNGTYSAMVSPSGSIWDIKFLDSFILGLKKVTPNVTGFPVTHRVMIRMAANAITGAMIYSFIIILILLIIDYRKFDEVVLALIPLVIGMLWLQGVLYLFKIDYNVANIAGLPLLLGLGIVYGLRIVHRWRENVHVTAFAATHTTGRGLAFAALAIISGLFSIMFARHNGVSAFGIILFFGIVICLCTALFILPAVIDLKYVITQDIREKGRAKRDKAMREHHDQLDRKHQELMAKTAAVKKSTKKKTVEKKAGKKSAPVKTKK